MSVIARTDRLLLRRVRATDAEELWRRRNDPDVARHQGWTLPYPRARAEALVATVAGAERPAVEDWWMITVSDRSDRVVHGDLAVHLASDGHTAEIGYTFARTSWGHGYAVEAVAALVRWLVEDFDVHRVTAMTHPENLASARVLERVGMTFEGRTRHSYWVGDDVSDDLVYGTIRPDWEAWLARPRRPPDDVTLIEVDAANHREVAKLATHHSQERFVAPVTTSFADALFPEIVDGAAVEPWMRAVRADGELAAFVMLALSTPQHPTPYLWRLLVDRRHQGRGIGGRVLDLVAEECRGRGDDTLLTSWVEGRGSPRTFYERRGFVPTGRLLDGETEASVALS